MKKLIVLTLGLLAGSSCLGMETSTQSKLENRYKKIVANLNTNALSAVYTNDPAPSEKILELIKLYELSLLNVLEQAVEQSDFHKLLKKMNLLQPKISKFVTKINKAATEDASKLMKIMTQIDQLNS